MRYACFFHNIHKMFGYMTSVIKIIRKQCGPAQLGFGLGNQQHTYQRSAIFPLFRPAAWQYPRACERLLH